MNKAATYGQNAGHRMQFVRPLIVEWAEWGGKLSEIPECGPPAETSVKSKGKLVTVAEIAKLTHRLGFKHSSHRLLP
jgi:hypothetical protein